MRKKEVKNFPQKYLITSAQACEHDVVLDKSGEIVDELWGEKGAPNNAVLESFENYCSEMGANLIILPMAGKNAGEVELNPELSKRNDILWSKSKRLNENIHISNMVVPPQNVDPSSGRGRFVQGDQTLIMAHPKQRVKAFPNSNFDLPKILVGTGAITYPNYNETNHRGDAAKRDHTYGGIIVEIMNDKIFHFRNMRALKNGKCIDLGLEFKGNQPKKEAKLEALVLGDLHVGDTDPEVRKANYEMIREFNPKRLVIHDLFNGHSVNHHNIGKLVTQVREVIMRGRQNLGEELKHVYYELCELSKAMQGREILVVPSNHNEFLDRYLDGVRLINDAENAYLAVKLMGDAMEGKNPCESGIKRIAEKMRKKIPNNVRFLKREEDYKVLGWQLASHGDLGMGGSRGSMRAREFANGKSITGHTHVPEILRNTYVVGTSTRLNLSYTKGQPSAWMNSNVLLWENGMPQLVNIIYGNWRAKK
jgi:hypothetical protein